MLRQMPPYRPTLYRPDSRGRFRLYPRVVQTPIPGAGYHVGDMVWAEQELDLDGGGPLMPYGSYAQVPLRGLGASPAMMSAATKMTAPQFMYIRPDGGTPSPPPAPDTSMPDAPPPPSSPEDYGFDVAAAIEQAAREAAATPEPPAEEEPGFFEKKVGPVPVWALGLGGVALAGGAAFFFLRRGR